MPYSTFCRTVFHGNSAKFWNTTPRSGPGPATMPLAVRMLPLFTPRKPPMQYSNVLLPQPLGPSRAWKLPAGTVSDTSSSARTAAPILLR